MKEEDPVGYDIEIARIARGESDKEAKKIREKKEYDDGVAAAVVDDRKQILTYLKKRGIDITNPAELQKAVDDKNHQRVFEFADLHFIKDKYGRSQPKALEMSFLLMNKNQILTGAHRKGADDLLDKLEKGIPEHQEPTDRSGKDVRKDKKKDIVQEAKNMGRDVPTDDLNAAIEEEMRQESEA